MGLSFSELCKLARISDSDRHLALSRLPESQSNAIQPFIKKLERIDWGSLKPSTPSQVQFKAVCEDEVPAKNLYESSYLAYRRALSSILQERYRAKNNGSHQPPTDVPLPDHMKNSKGRKKPSSSSKYGIPEHEDGSPNEAWKPLGKYQ